MNPSRESEGLSSTLLAYSSHTELLRKPESGRAPATKSAHRSAELLKRLYLEKRESETVKSSRSAFHAQIYKKAVQTCQVCTVLSLWIARFLFVTYRDFSVAMFSATSWNVFSPWFSSWRELQLSQMTPRDASHEQQGSYTNLWKLFFQIEQW